MQKAEVRSRRAEAGRLPGLAVLTSAFCILTSAFAVAAPAAGDQVLFVRDEPLLLYGKPAATAKKGQVYTVLTSQPDEGRVYVLAKNTAGKPVSLNASDFAVVVLPGRGEPDFQRGLDDLRLGRWPDAARRFAAAGAAEPGAALYGQVGASVEGVLGAQRALGQAVAAQEKAAVESARQRRNADRTPARNPLFPDDSSGLARATAYRRIADDLDAAAETTANTARAALEASAADYDATLRALADAHAVDAVRALLDARARLLPGRAPDALGNLAHADLPALNDLVSDAAAALAAGGRALAANRLAAADHEAAGGLAALPGDRALKALQMRAQMRLAAVRDRGPEIDAAEKAGDDAGALRLVNALLAESVDDPDLLRRKAALEARLAGKASAARGAQYR